MDTAVVFSPVIKYTVEVTTPGALAEMVSNAFRVAKQGHLGNAFASLSQDMIDGPVNDKVLPTGRAPRMNAVPDDAIDQVTKPIAQTKDPISLFGLMASQPGNSVALRYLLEASRIPVTSTYRTAGAVS